MTKIGVLQSEIKKMQFLNRLQGELAKRGMVHFALDDANIKFCTKLDGKKSWFLPFDKGYNDGAGNPPNPNGIMTDYLWNDIFTKGKLSRIIENYAQVVVEEDPNVIKLSKTCQMISATNRLCIGMIGGFRQLSEALSVDIKYYRKFLGITRQ